MDIVFPWKLVPVCALVLDSCVMRLNVHSVQQTFVLFQFGLKSLLYTELNDNTV